MIFGKGSLCTHSTPKGGLCKLDYGHQSTEVVRLVSTDMHFAKVAPGDKVSSEE